MSLSTFPCGATCSGNVSGMKLQNYDATASSMRFCLPRSGVATLCHHTFDKPFWCVIIGWYRAGMQQTRSPQKTPHLFLIGLSYIAVILLRRIPLRHGQYWQASFNLLSHATFYNTKLSNTTGAMGAARSKNGEFR